VFQALKIARHVAVDERDPDTGVDGKPAVLPAEHLGSRSSIEQARASEPADHSAPHPLGDRGQISLVDRVGGRLFSAGGFAFAPPAREPAARRSRTLLQAA
jgi:hypothetical protein